MNGLPKRQRISSNKLPRCWFCGIILTPETGGSENLVSFHRHTICGSCYKDIRKNGYIHFGKGVFVLLNGDICYLKPDKLAKFFLMDNPSQLEMLKKEKKHRVNSIKVFRDFGIRKLEEGGEDDD